jgi:hypothetical protein
MPIWLIVLLSVLGGICIPIIIIIIVTKLLKKYYNNFQ